ncbi:MAG: hypothetical protein AB8I08_02270 [Sandaracinaceae bacterium]
MRLLMASCLLVSLLPSCRSRVRWTPNSGQPYPGTFGRPARGVAQGYSPRWTDTAPPDTGVRFSMPTQPVVEARTARDEDGAQRFEVVARSESAFGFFAVFTARWEGGLVGDPLRAIADSAASIFERADLQRQNARRLSVTGYYAREDTGTNAQQAHVVLRQFVGSDRVIVALALVPNRPPNVQIANQFLASIGLNSQHALFGQAGQRQADGSWTPVYMPESDFAISMPAAPAIIEDELVVAEASRTRRVFEARDSWGRYRVQVIRFGEWVPDEAYGELQTLLRVGRNVRPVESQGFPGRVFVADSGAERSWIRMFRTRGRVYVVEATGARDSVRDRRVGTRLNRYFNSFRIL